MTLSLNPLAPWLADPEISKRLLPKPKSSFPRFRHARAAVSLAPSPSRRRVKPGPPRSRVTPEKHPSPPPHASAPRHGPQFTRGPDPRSHCATRPRRCGLRLGLDFRGSWHLEILRDGTCLPTHLQQQSNPIYAESHGTLCTSQMHSSFDPRLAFVYDAICNPGLGRLHSGLTSAREQAPLSQPSLVRLTRPLRPCHPVSGT